MPVARFLRLPTATLLALAAGRATAQPAPAPAAAQPPWLHALSINPVGIPFGVYSAEYEAALPVPGVTAAVGGTATVDSPLYDHDHRWLSARVMYYPGEVALRGVAVGVSLGGHRARRDDGRAEGAATLGILGSYNRLIGRQQRLVLGTGAGFRRVLRNVGDGSPLRQAYPDGRILLGFAF